ncbi:MAG: NAD(P)H-hydrate epimerase [Planctomycetes bacterium]|nr:NAD(P)H-hydrate epimerase [Planctomycetota bacterium]
MESPFARPPRPLSRAEVREVDRRAIEDLGLPGLVLMENAGRGLTAAVDRDLRARGAPPGAEVLVVCGRGNNGGDGFVLARHLLLLGWRPRVALAGRLAQVDRATDAGVNLGVLERVGEQVHEAPDGPALTAWLGRWPTAPLVVDALYGTGLEGALRDPGLGLVQALDRDPRPKVAVDLPSGLDCDQGVPLGAAVRAARTVTFVHEKRGFAAAGARAYTGEVEVVPIGCPAAAWGHVV